MAVLLSTSPKQQRRSTTILGLGGGTVSWREARRPVIAPRSWQPAVISSSRTDRGYALTMRRFRLTFSKGEPVRYISHLDLMRTWERTLRRAAVKLAHSQGFNPRPRLVFAAPLPVGVTSDAEIVDVVVEDDGSAAEFVRRLEPALAPGMAV